MTDPKTRRSQGSRLKAARLTIYKSAREAALDNEWPESTYRAHESGTRTIGQDDAERYAKRFSTSAKYILFGDNSHSEVDILNERLNALTPARRQRFIASMMEALAVLVEETAPAQVQSEDALNTVAVRPKASSKRR